MGRAKTYFTQERSSHSSGSSRPSLMAAAMTASSSVRLSPKMSKVVSAATLPPGQPDPAPHVRRSYDETWLILKSTLEFGLAYASRRAVAGSFVFIRRGVRHSFAQPGTRPGLDAGDRQLPVQAMIEELGAGQSSSAGAAGRSSAPPRGS